MKKKRSIALHAQGLDFIDYYNSALIATVVVAAVVLAVSLRFGARSGTDTLPFSKEAIGIVPKFKFVKKSVQYYDRILGRDSLFVAQSGAKTADAEPVEAGLQAGDLQLLGIVSGARGLQAIISETKTEQSYYCYAGELIEGIIVKEIFSDKVVLQRNEETFELRL